AYADEHLFEGDEAERIRVREWVFEPGLPDNVPGITSAAFAAVDTQVAAFARGTAPAQLRTENWATHEWLRFLRALPDTLGTESMAALDDAFGFTQSGNSEILFAWLRLAIRNRYEPAMPALDRFLTTQGRRKSIAPLFQELMDSG